jgi:anti-anti-sigma regulatory factor
LRTADDTHAKLLEMSARHASLEIDCSGADDVDLSFVQLLLAARSSARLSDRTIRLAHPASGALRDALQRGGFLTDVTDQAADRAFWLQPEGM